MKYLLGSKLTIFSVSSFMATTLKQEVEIVSESQDRAVFRTQSKRKLFFLPEFNDSTLVFEGWDLPIKTDSDVFSKEEMFTTNLMRGNACLNLVGDIELIREYVQHKNLNENFKRLDVVIQIDGAKENPVFWNVPTNHAVVERIRANA